MKLTKTVVFLSLIICTNLYSMQHDEQSEPKVIQYGEWTLPKEYNPEKSNFEETVNGKRWEHLRLDCNDPQKKELKEPSEPELSRDEPCLLRKDSIPPALRRVASDSRIFRGNTLEHCHVEQSELAVIVTVTTTISDSKNS